MFDFSKARKSSQKLENSTALSDFPNSYTSVSIYSRCSLCSHYAAQKKSCVAQKIVVSTKKYFANIAQQNYVSHKKICGDKKNYVTPKRRLTLTKYV